MATIRMIALLIICLFGSTALAADVQPDWKSLRTKLKRAHFSEAFIARLKASYSEEDFREVLALNVLLFLRKSDYHGPQVSDDAVLSVKKFVQEHHSVFSVAETKYGVSPYVVASLMWIESRYGDNQGRFHVLSAFAHLAQADDPKAIRYLQSAAVPRFTRRLTSRTRKEIAVRARRKAKWALGELKAMAKMDPDLVHGLKGSFAGAFGMPQFLPSSYARYARAFGGGRPADLTAPDDAIESVAHYLSASGWKRGRKRTYERALLNYNHSTDYARAILRLAARAEGRESDEPRRPASRRATRPARH